MACARSVEPSLPISVEPSLPMSWAISAGVAPAARRRAAVNVAPSIPTSVEPSLPMRLPPVREMRPWRMPSVRTETGLRLVSDTPAWARRPRASATNWVGIGSSAPEIASCETRTGTRPSGAASTMAIAGRNWTVLDT